MSGFCKACGATELSPFVELHHVPKAAQCFIAADDDDYNNDHCDLSIYKCKNCGHVQSHAPLVSYYKDVVTAASLSPRIVKSRIDMITKIMSMHDISNPSILEVGCYKGCFLKELTAYGFYDVYGIEHNIDSVNKAVERGINVSAGYLLDKDFDLESLQKVDILCCFNFLEHIPDPFQFLQNCKKLLKANGYMYFTLPSFNFIERTSCLHEFIADHLSYFSQSSLELLFRRSMLTPVEINQINNNNDLEIVATFKKKEIVEFDHSLYFNLLNSLNHILDSAYSHRKTVAIWGAGHRALTLLTQINYEGISCIIDSAPFKVGKYSPVTRLAIVSPKQYQFKPTDILFLALPGIYSDEVISEVMQWESKPSSIYQIGETSITCIWGDDIK